MKEITIDGVTYVLTPKEEKAVAQKPTLPKTWEELESINGWYIDEYSTVTSTLDCEATSAFQNIFATKEQAEASIALAQLSQLIEVYRNGWVPDFTNCNISKYCIVFYENKIRIDTLYSIQHFLAFQSKEIAQEFLNNFSDLILKAQPLLG